MHRECESAEREIRKDRQTKEVGGWLFGVLGRRQVVRCRLLLAMLCLEWNTCRLSKKKNEK